MPRSFVFSLRSFWSFWCERDLGPTVPIPAPAAIKSHSIDANTSKCIPCTRKTECRIHSHSVDFRWIFGCPVSMYRIDLCYYWRIIRLVLFSTFNLFKIRLKWVKVFGFNTSNLATLVAPNSVPSVVSNNQPIWMSLTSIVLLYFQLSPSALNTFICQMV